MTGPIKSENGENWSVKQMVIFRKNLDERLKKLSADDRELLTQIVMDGLTKAEVARLRGVTRQSINDKIQRIKKFLKKV